MILVRRRSARGWDQLSNYSYAHEVGFLPVNRYNESGLVGFVAFAGYFVWLSMPGRRWPWSAAPLFMVQKKVHAVRLGQTLYGMPVLSRSPFTLHPHYPREEYVVLQMDVLVKVLFELHERGE